MKYIEAYLNYLKVLKKDSTYTITNYRNDLLELYDFTTELTKITKKNSPRIFRIFIFKRFKKKFYF